MGTRGDHTADVFVSRLVRLMATEMVENLHGAPVPTIDS